jgi:class 3 adenylate cyclase
MTADDPDLVFGSSDTAVNALEAAIEDTAAPGDVVEAGQALLAEHRRLQRDLRRLIRLSDKREHKLNEARRELELRNKMLEGLSLKLSRYLSPSIYKSIFDGFSDVRPEGRRRKLTIFFSDIADFTEIAERLEAEDLVEFLNHYISEMTDLAVRHGATVDKYIGDAIMLFFGDPETKGVAGDAESCVAMALDMQRRIEELETTWRTKGFTRPFRVRMGINTGFCTVGNFGSETKLDYTIVGTQVNLAARLQAMAPQGGILLSDETWSIVKDRFIGEPFGQLKMKGIPYPVPTHLVTGDRRTWQGEVIEKKRPGLDLRVEVDSMNREQLESSARLLATVAQTMERRARRMAPQEPAMSLDDLLFGNSGS